MGVGDDHPCCLESVVSGPLGLGHTVDFGWTVWYRAMITCC